jgi:Xaa-Pro aminopeptidase
VRNGGANEFEIQQWIVEAFRREGLVFDDPAIVGVNPNSGNPHYSPSRESALPIRKGDFVLIDMWGKLDRPNAVYYDITWTGVVGGNPSDRQQEVFRVVKAARDAGFNRVKSALEAGQRIAGWQVDEITRETINKAGFGQYFTHRTGHSIGTEIHANGANMDNLETKDDREIIPNSCFSIEPGIYLPEFGVRSEFNVLVRNGSAEVTGRIQQELVKI